MLVGLLRRFVARLGAEALLGVHHLIELVVRVVAAPLALALHSFVAGGDELSGVLLPGVERRLLLLEREFIIAHHVGQPRSSPLDAQSCRF